MAVRAILLDFDGTLADSFAAITASVNHARSHFGLGPLTQQQVHEAVGFGLAQLMDELVPGVEPAEALEVYRAHHMTVFLEQTRLLPGVLATLEALNERGLALAVCSNKRVEFTRQLVGRLGLAGLVRETLGPEDVARPKPDPAMLLEACRRLGIQPSEAIYIGDMAVDLHAGRAAGMTTWLVPGGPPGREDPKSLNPDRMLRDFAEILELLPAG